MLFCSLPALIQHQDVKTAFTEPPPTVSSNPKLWEMRTGKILQEALSRYNLNAVPYWSCLYGVYIMRGEEPENYEDAVRNLEWTSIVGECWKIPHDGRVNFCFQASMADYTTIVRVRNFVYHFHRSERSDAPKGERFNVWDWFDTGISTYWYPGKRTPTIPLEAAHMGTQTTKRGNNEFPMSKMIAPWRRMMYVNPQICMNRTKWA